MRILLTTLGSLGDLHPFLGLGMELKSRGHDVVVATHECYRGRVSEMGLFFRPIRPDYDPEDVQGNRLAMDRLWGSRYILAGIFSSLAETYDDLKEALAGADLLVSQAIVFPAPILAEQTGIPWVSVVLSPAVLLTYLDPPQALPFTWMNRLLCATPWLTRKGLDFIWKETLRWCKPVRDFRRSLGLDEGKHPLFEGQHSPSLSLAMFSEAFAAPQPDWPESMVQTGFVFHDSAKPLSPELADFLEAGGRPVVFTLGSAAVISPGAFFTRSFESAREMGCRAVLVTKPDAGVSSTPDILVTRYAPYGDLFARAAAVVHQGGIGTTAQALRAGCPALIVPFAHDQPDNAARVVRLGAGRMLSRTRYTSDAAKLELGVLLGNQEYRYAAESIGDAIRAEDGARAAADAILRQWDFS